MASFKPRGVVAGGWELPYSYLSPLKLGLGLSLAITRNLERQIGSNAEYGKIQVLINVCQKPKLASTHPQLQLGLIRRNMTTVYPDRKSAPCPRQCCQLSQFAILDHLDCCHKGPNYRTRVCICNKDLRPLKQKGS